MLSFVFYNLLKNPDAYRAAREEVDRVMGTGAATVRHLKELKYLNATLPEAIRLHPTAPALTLQAHATPDGHFRLGDYVVEGRPPIIALLEKIHRDPEVWGDDADAFKPERMLDEHFDKLPRNAWKVSTLSSMLSLFSGTNDGAQPFGNGSRACIGRAFAWQEALLATAIVLQRFDLELADPDYSLQIKFTLTIKPKDFYMRARLRHGLDPTTLAHALNAPTGVAGPHGVPRAPTAATAGANSTLPKLSVLYGSNTGTCEALAQRLVADAGQHGFAADAAPLDAVVGAFPADRPVVMITASYEGQPPDNAAKFVTWLEGLSGHELKGARFAVFGCGNRT